LETASFYQERHQIIWTAILELYKTNTPADIVTLCSALDSVGKLQAVGGKDYIFQLMESVASAANAKWHAELIQKKAVLRTLISAANKTIRNALDAAAEPEEIIQEAEKDIMDLAEKRVRDSLRPAGAVVNDVLKALDNRKGGMTGCPTGFADLDRLTNGLQPSD
jgi:replicative DNA helicase